MTDQELAVLRVIGRLKVPTGNAISSELVTAGRDVSPAGAHRTSASLVKKNLAKPLGTPKLRWYGVTPLGTEMLHRNRRRP